jgi:hypothetical protein
MKKHLVYSIIGFAAGFLTMLELSSDSRHIWGRVARSLFQTFFPGVHLTLAGFSYVWASLFIGSVIFIAILVIRGCLSLIKKSPIRFRQLFLGYYAGLILGIVVASAITFWAISHLFDNFPS